MPKEGAKKDRKTPMILLSENLSTFQKPV